MIAGWSKGIVHKGWEELQRSFRRSTQENNRRHSPCSLRHSPLSRIPGKGVEGVVVPKVPIGLSDGRQVEGGGKGGRIEGRTDE